MTRTIPILLVITIALATITGFPSNLRPFLKKLSPTQVTALREWNENSKQAKWEISGQIEGDMISTRMFKNGAMNPALMWKNRVIPYQLDPSYTEDDAKWIKKALDVFHRETCLRFRNKKAKDKDYISVHNSQGCSGSVGRQGGSQLLILEREPHGTGCFKEGTIVHEFLHAAGFYHQHNSPDRDQYVRVNKENINGSQRIQFEKLDNKTATTFNLPYDYGSVMHYSRYAFSNNGKPTLEPLVPNVEIGQREGTSEIDIQKVNLKYCPHWRSKSKRKNTIKISGSV